MVRNLLYSICLHLIFVLFIIFSEKINDALTNKVVNIDGLNVESDFLERNNIKITDTNIYSNLTLSEKIELYELAKGTYNKNNKFTEFNSDSLKKKLKAYEKIENISPNAEEDNSSYKSNEILYLGPKDYKKLMAKLEKKRKEREKKEQTKKDGETKDELEPIKEAKAIKEEDYIKDLKKNNIKLSKTKKTENKVKKNTQNIKNTVVPIDSSESDNYTQNTENTDNKIILENVKNGNITNAEINAKKNHMADKRITEILSKNLNGSKQGTKEETIVKKEDNEIIEKFNIDIDKIFTKTDLKNIKKHIREDGLGALTLREKVNIQNQIIMCYKNAILQTKKNNKVKVSVTLKLFQDGIIDTKKINIKIIDDKNEFNENEYNNAIENIKLALAYCNPIRNLPLIKYQNWQYINFIFDTTTIN